MRNTDTPTPSNLPTTAHTADDLVLPVEGLNPTRRSFLRLAGFGIAASALAGCSRGATRFVVPRLDEAGATLPGRATWIATTCAGCEASCGVLARCRDGRPVKLEGNAEHPASRGGLCAVGQAGVLDLYDGLRTDGPTLGGAPTSWETIDAAVVGALGAANRGAVRLLTRTITSPSARAAIEHFTQRHDAEHIEWDPRSAGALLDAHTAAFGVRALPTIRIDEADVVVSFDADFLGTWISPVAFAKQYAARRRVEDTSRPMSRHVHVESRLSLTGGAADERVLIAPWEQRAALATLCRRLAELAGDATLPDDEPGLEQAHAAAESERLQHLAEELWTARGRALVLCGSDDPAAQSLAIYANRLLGSYGATLDLERPALIRRGDDRALARLIGEMRDGTVGVLIIDGLDLVHEIPDDAGLRDALANVAMIVTTAVRPDATTPLATAVAPTPHELESWNDAEAVTGQLSLSQPTVPPLRSARTLRTSLARWSGDARDDAALVRDHWRNHVHGRSGSLTSFETYFDTALRDGHAEVPARGGPSPRWNAAAWRALLAGTAHPKAPDDGRLVVVVHSNVGVPESRHAHNAWLQELPDPLTCITWDNCACLAPETAAALGLEDGDVIRVAADDSAAAELPVRVVPGQHPGVVCIARGYGVTGTDRFSRIGPDWLEGEVTVRDGDTVGARAASFLTLDAVGLRVASRSALVTSTGKHVELASTQDHHRLEVPRHLQTARGARRDAILSTTLDEYRADPAHAVHRHEPADVGLWPADHQSDGPRWGMVIDLGACNGCSGCVVACQSENNVPSVGRDEVRRHREMTWLRVDRYFDGEGGDVTLRHQPMMCQHCANAPCETVCPVLATVHSADGLNQQVYNRCVGTRYCANNCPYKTRRFNWFDYPRADELQRLALNPDVTVRSRGVMEKCSMCVQRIQDAKAESRRTGTPVADGDIQTACQQSCPTDAIAFGNLEDESSAVARLARSPRAYAVLAELNVKPGVTYLAEIRNRPAADAGGHDE